MTNLIARDVSALKTQCVFNSLGNFHDHVVAKQATLSCFSAYIWTPSISLLIRRDG
jgi:hypothetical protein